MPHHTYRCCNCASIEHAARNLLCHWCTDINRKQEAFSCWFNCLKWKKKKRNQTHKINILISSAVFNPRSRALSSPHSFWGNSRPVMCQKLSVSYSFGWLFNKTPIPKVCVRKFQNCYPSKLFLSFRTLFRKKSLTPWRTVLPWKFGKTRHLKLLKCLHRDATKASLCFHAQLYRFLMQPKYGMDVFYPTGKRNQEEDLKIQTP